MKLSRVLVGRVAGVAACFTLVALGGCGSSVAAMDGGNRDGAIGDRDGALLDAGTRDGYGARDASVPIVGPRACADGEWCAELPSNFVGTPTLVGDQPIATVGNNVYVLRANEWTRVACPADSGTTDGPELLASDSNVTIARCGTRRYRWSADGFAPIDWPAGVLLPPDNTSVVFGLPDVVFASAAMGASRFVVRCSDRGCDTIELDSIGVPFPRWIFARSAEEFWVFGSGSSAWRHTATGWSSVPVESVARALDVQWPPAPGAECLSDGRWVSCAMMPAAERFFVHRRTVSAVIARTQFGEVVLFDGTTTQRLRAVSARSFARDNWPALSLVNYTWAAPSAIEGVQDGADDRLFMLFAAGRHAEGTGYPFASRQKLFTRLGDGPWLEVPGGEFDSAAGTTMSASSSSSLWVLGRGAIHHLVDGSWSSVAGDFGALCALRDGSVVAQEQRHALRVSAMGERGDSAPAMAMFACTRDDVWIHAYGVASHLVGGAWVAVPEPPIAAASREYGRSELGITVRNSDGSAAYVWGGAAWQRRDEANASFFVNLHPVRFATREWAVWNAPDGTLLYRDRR